MWAIPPNVETVLNNVRGNECHWALVLCEASVLTRESARKPPYQILPNLSKDDYAQLKADIARRGVLVSVEVDETGAILDGHHRQKIAQELGLKFPTTVRRGLSEAEKYLHAVSLNVSRRHLTDGQKVLLGLAIEPLIAARARERQVSALKRGAKLPSPANAGNGETADEVARTVGLGSRRHLLSGAKGRSANPPSIAVAPALTTFGRAGPQGGSP